MLILVIDDIIILLNNYGSSGRLTFHTETVDVLPVTVWNVDRFITTLAGVFPAWLAHWLMTLDGDSQSVKYWAVRLRDF